MSDTTKKYTPNRKTGNLSSCSMLYDSDKKDHECTKTDSMFINFGCFQDQPKEKKKEAFLFEADDTSLHEFVIDLFVDESIDDDLLIVSPIKNIDIPI